MNIKREKKEIDGLMVETQQFAALRGSRLFLRLLKSVGPAMGAMMKLDPNTELEGAGAELAAAFSALDVDEADRLIPELLSSTTVTVDGKHVPLTNTSAIDMVFSGRIFTMYKVLGFAVQVNYRDPTSGGSAAPKHPSHSDG